MRQAPSTAGFKAMSKKELLATEELEPFLSMQQMLEAVIGGQKKGWSIQNNKNRENRPLWPKLKTIIVTVLT